MSLGHALRDGVPPSPSALPPPAELARVVIAGAGVAGLACARELRRSGVDGVRIFEIAGAAGGTARGGKSPLTRYPWGAHYITAPMRENTDLVAFLDDLGLFDAPAAGAGAGHATPDVGRARAARADRDPVPREEIACRAPEERIFFRGRFYSGLYLREGATSDDLAQLARFGEILGALSGLVDGGGRAFAIPRERESAGFAALRRALDGVSFAAWLDAQRFTSWRLRWLCDYACRDDYGLTLETTSAYAGLFYFCSRRRAAEAQERPVMTWPQGNAFLVDALRTQAGATGPASPTPVALDDAVLNVVPAGDAVDVVVRDKAGHVRVVRAEHVVLAVPRFIAARVAAPLRERPRDVVTDELRRFDTTPWVVCNLHLREHPKSRGFPLAWDTVFLESKSLGYVTATHQRGADIGPTVLTWYMPLVEGTPADARRKLVSLSRAEWAEAAVSDIAIAHPGARNLVERVDVCRWGHAMIRPEVGLFSSGVLESAQRPTGRIHFAHTDLSGVALFEEAFFHGVRAAREIVAARSA